MLGSRNRSASVKQTTSKRPDSKASQKSGLFGVCGGGLSDGVEGSSSSSGSSSNSGSGATHEANYLHQKLVKNQLQYLGSDGSVFTLAQPRGNLSKENQLQQHQHQHQHQQHRSNYLTHTDGVPSSNSPNFSTTVNLEPNCHRKEDLSTNSSDQRQQQHRRLQYQVHQQLQRIYGNTERRDQNQLSSDNRPYMVDQQLKPQQQQQNSNNHLQHRQLPQIRQQQRQQIVDRMQQRNSSSASVNFANQQQLRASLIKNSHLMMVNSQSDQTYDSLSPASVSKQQLNEGFYAIDSNNNHLRQNPISAIPEECNDGDEDEDELLIPAQTVASSRVALDRKNQLEDLHYATATAAALLSATANAAAAFAANADKQFDKKQVANELRGCGSAVEQQNLINTIYSDAYQEVRRQQRCLNEPYPIAYKKQQHHYHHHHLNNRNSIYADSLDQQANFLAAHNSESRQRNQIGPATSTSSAIYSPLIRGNVANQSQIYSILPSNYQQYQATNFNRQIPPQPPLRRLLARPPQPGRNSHHTHQQQNNHYYHQHDLLNQHQQLLQLQQRQRLQQQQLAQQQQQQHHQQQCIPTSNASALAIPLPLPASVPTLAIVHQGKNTSIKADLLGRMLVNNMIAAQQAAAKSADSTHYAASSAVRSRAMVEPRNNIVGGQILSPGGGDKIYRAPGHVFSVAPALAPSESSGQSNVPLVLDRELKRIGFIERICRIDLAVFWWSLIIVSFLFIGIMITITRYIF